MRKIFFLFPCIILFMIPAKADELIWEPINPAFGGNSLNGNWLLAHAQLQEPILGPKTKPAYSEPDPNEQFQETLNRLILNRLSSRIVDSITGDGNLTPGHFEIGTYSVTIVEQGNLFIITLDDLATGNHTVIEIPAL